ncbi:transcriptional regulator (plasmid) [Spirillospora sp. CA-255316]
MTTTPTGRATERAARAALLIGVWYAAHHVADHIGQRHRDALAKGKPGAEGRAACARHVANLTATKGLALAVASAATGIRLHPGRVAAAMAADAATHYVIDRREPLRRLAEALGKGEFYGLGDELAAPCGTGRYVMDQSVHLAALTAAALYAAR